MRRFCIGLGVAALALAGAMAWMLGRPFAGLGPLPAATLLTDCRDHALGLQLGPDDMDCRPFYEPRPHDWICRAIVAAEDQRFWTHPGVDLYALLRAAWQNVSQGRRVSGASTLSMQVIRMDHPRPRHLRFKLQEAQQALRMERALTKEEILAEYLHRAPFGGNRVGIDAASRRYFNKDPSELSLAEAALLAGLPQAPSRLRPDRFPLAARQRQAYVLNRMAALGMITAEEKELAQRQPVALRNTRYPFEAPHFCRFLEKEYPGKLRGGACRTTLDSRLQTLAETTVQRHLPELAAQGIESAAVVIQDVRLGAVRAMVGSPDFFARRGQVNAATAPRAAGSTLKPFAYALACDRGQLTPAQMLADVPRQFADSRPGNFDPAYRGLVPAGEALALSLNMPALAVVEKTGVGVFHQWLWELGLRTLNRGAEHYGLGLALGNGPVRLLDLANAYACLARLGRYYPARFFEEDLFVAAAGRQLFSPEAAWLVAEMLSGDERGVAITGHDADVQLPRLAWKTGTSAGLKDGWTVAYNPEYVVAVWVGNPAGRASENLVGRSTAAPIAWDLFRQLYPDNTGPWFERPAGVQAREVCAESGCPPGPYCRTHRLDWHIAGVSSCRTCPVHPLPPGPDGQLAAHWPPEVAAFLQKQSRPSTKAADQPAARNACALRITSPAAGTVYLNTPLLTAASQRIPLRAAGDGWRELHWFVDDHYLGPCPPTETLYWPLTKGKHQIVCALPNGPSDKVEILVE